jgi:hypothetical protein
MAYAGQAFRKESKFKILIQYQLKSLSNIFCFLASGDVTESYFFWNRVVFLESLCLGIDDNFIFFIYSLSKMFLNKQAEVKYWQCNLKRRPTKTNIFYALSLHSAGGRTVNFNLSLLIYMLLLIRSSPTEIPR